ncbi:5-formyltetrahydrofolate cyclo-ligase [Micrococcoides hystricis]|uniref:5-formyltetrahydrofolate cyclo-ligase n=1 Tax=Micrococcoides hystricis TaxID=1572761 RepID=A0ABV6P9Z5_9MICC
MSTHSDVDEAKRRQRAFFVAERKNMSQAERNSAAALITSHLRPWLTSHSPHRRITATLPFGTELPLHQLLQQLVEEDHFEVLMPICLPERQLAFTPWYPGVEMARCAYAPIDEPVGPRFGADVFDEVDVMLVPAQAIDFHGYRLGHGGGYYDRFLAKVKALSAVPTLLGMVYQHEFVPPGTFPVDEHDQAVDGVVTQLGFNWMF